MKRKKTEPRPKPEVKAPEKKKGGLSALAASLSPKADAVQEHDGAWRTPDTVKLCLFSLLLFVSMTLLTGRMSVILTFLALAASLPIGREPLRNLRQRLCVPVLGLLALGSMHGLAAIYSDFGGIALKEFYKFLAAFALAAILLFRFEKKHVRPLLWVLAAVSALIAFLSVDAAGPSVFFDGLAAVVERLGGTFEGVEQYSGEARVAGIYNDANITASVFALGSLLSLYLLHTEERRAEKGLASLALGVSAMGFFLSLSRAAILCFALALLAWLTAEGKGRRVPLFLRMVFSAVVVLALSVLAMRAVGRASFVPLLLTLLAGAPIFLLDLLLTERLSAALAAHRKGLLIGAGALAALAVCYVIAGIRLTGPYTFPEGTRTLSRGADLAAGEYHFSGDWDPELTVRVYTETPEQTLMGGYTGLYEGPLSEAAFTLEEDDYVKIDFWGYPGETLREVTLSGGTEIPLRYRLLPSVLMDRLQGSLLEDSSFLLRAQYMKDAWTLFAQSPLIGHGLASTEALYPAVQPFYYESQYVHNHLLQYMSDMGLLGLAAFLLLAGGVLWLVLKALRREEDRPLAAALLACLCMMNLHALMEFTFSIRGYQIYAYCLLVLPVLLYARPVSQRAVRVGGLVLAAGFWLYLAVFGGLTLSKRMVDREAQTLSTSDAHEYLDMMRRVVRRDVFDPEQAQLNFVASTATAGVAQYNHDMLAYVEALRKSGTYSACSGLAQYYYLPRGEYEEMFAASREAIAQVASISDAWNLQLNFYRTGVLQAMTPETMKTYLRGVVDLKLFLEEYGEGRLEETALTTENRNFINWSQTLLEEYTDGLEELTFCYHSVQEAFGTVVEAVVPK